MHRRSRRFFAATAAIALLSLLLGVNYLSEAPAQQADITLPATPFSYACWQQTLMAGRW